MAKTYQKPEAAAEVLGFKNTGVTKVCFSRV